MNNFDKELGFEGRVRKCVVNDGVYKGWLAKIIEADFPDYKVIGYNVMGYRRDIGL